MASEYGDTAQIGGDLNVTGSSTFNEDSADVDFRIESNNNVNMFYVNGGTDKIGIGTQHPSGTLHISSSATNSTASVWIQGEGDAELRIIADFPDAGGINDSNPSIYLSQEAGASNPDAYKLQIGIEGTADQTFAGSYPNQPFILSKNSELAGVRTFQIATDVGSGAESRFCIAHSGKIQIANEAREGDCRLHVKDVAGDIFKLENTTAYGVTHGQLVATGVTLGAASSPVDTGLNLPAYSIVDTVVIKLTTVGAVSSGVNFNVTNVTLSGAAPLIAQTIFSASLPNIGLIPAFQAQSGTMYYLNNNQTNYPVGAIGQLPNAAQDIKLDYSAANVSSNSVMDVAVYYRKFDTIR